MIDVIFFYWCSAPVRAITVNGFLGGQEPTLMQVAVTDSLRSVFLCSRGLLGGVSRRGNES
jgi:hypothetical protein